MLCVFLECTAMSILLIGPRRRIVQSDIPRTSRENTRPRECYRAQWIEETVENTLNSDCWFVLAPREVVTDRTPLAQFGDDRAEALEARV